jgi:hypothetical protein
MTFDEYFLQLSFNVWPEGEARNLRRLHKDWLRYGLIDLQKKIPCLQAENVENIVHDATYFFCGASAFQAPNGFIQNLRVIPNLQDTADPRQCDAVYAKPLSRQELECKLEYASRCGESACCASGPYYNLRMPTGTYDAFGSTYEYPQLDFGLMFPDARTDKPCRARDRYFAMWGCYLYLYPVINSDELIIIEWHGIKKNWQDSDVIPYLDEAGEVDPQISEALELWLGHKKSLEPENCDNETAGTKLAMYNQKVAELIWQCREEGKVPARKDCFVDCNC